MEDREIRERARNVAEAFNREESRADGPMARLLEECRLIAREVSRGEYHRAGIFMRAVDTLRDLGFDVSGADTATRPHSTSIRKAAENAQRDTWGLWEITSKPANRGHRAFEVVNRADDLMECIDGDFGYVTLDEAIRRLHDAVTYWLDGDGKVVTGKCEDPLTGTAMVVFEKATPGEGFRPLISIGSLGSARELPERVLFNPPATIAFWGDGTKTVAKCSAEDEFSEYVGLLVCIAKRHLRVPRRKTFEDAMARLLKRAERP